MDAFKMADNLNYEIGLFKEAAEKLILKVKIELEVNGITKIHNITEIVSPQQDLLVFKGNSTHKLDWIMISTSTPFTVIMTAADPVGPIRTTLSN